MRNLFIGNIDIHHSFHFAVISQLVKGVKTKLLYVSIHILTKGEVCALKPV